jgi:hypothetical protein
MKKLVIFIFSAFLMFGCVDDSGTNISHDNISEDSAVPHPVPTSESEEFPPHAPNI